MLQVTLELHRAGEECSAEPLDEEVLLDQVEGRVEANADRDQPQVA